MEAHAMTAQDLIRTLTAAGFQGDRMETYLACWKAGDVPEQLKLLSGQRDNLLERIHQEEKQIDCLDYLVYQIKKGRVTV